VRVTSPPRCPEYCWWAELTHPWWAFTEAGYVVEIRSLQGGALVADGGLLVNGRTWTGFADAEEQFADDFVGMRIQPFRIETEARKIAGTNFVVDQRFRAFAVRDGRLITGQQPFSGGAAAQLVIEARGR
jgi:putative intracellular protease/amidase